MFAVAAGVLLLVNVFVMLADERRSELGMLRAMGMRRSLLVGGLATEGWLYAVLASALGALLGIGFGWLIAWRAGQILDSGREENALHLTFAFHGSTVVTGFALGSRDLDRHDRRLERPHRALQRDPGHPRHPRAARRSPAPALGAASVSSWRILGVALTHRSGSPDPRPTA